MDDLLEVLPDLVAHNLARPEVREGFLAEVAAALEVEGARTVREILGDDLGAVRDELVKLGAPLLVELAGAEALLDWLEPRVR